MSRGYVVLFLLLGVTGRSARAQDWAREAVARAEFEQYAGRFDDARTMITNVLPNCPVDSSGRACHAVLLSALGYIYQNQAQSDSLNRTRLIGNAVSFYEEATHYADDGAALSNLALIYRSRGRDDELERVLQRGRSVDPSRAGFFNLLLGDLYGDRDDWNRALVYYRAAMQAVPEDEAPRRRLVEAYAQLPADSLSSLFVLVTTNPEWEAQFPDASARAYELIATGSPSGNPMGRRACTRWLQLLSEAQLVSRLRLDAIGESWLAPALRQLPAFLNDPKLLPTDPLWRSEDGQEAVGHLALTWGRRHAAAGDTVGAEAYWRAGFDFTQGPPAVAVNLDLATELAALYHRHHSLDRTDAKFSRIEEALFAAKGSAYDRADKEAIQQFHTVLGIIYADRNAWTSAQPWRNAVYQLEHALATARTRDAETGSYQPLPHLRRLLADGYVVNGRHDDAVATYTSAAQAYLDADELRDAGKMLERVKSMSLQGLSARAGALQDVLVARQSASHSPSGKRPTAAQCEQTATDATRRAGNIGLEAPFVARQRFKLVADCVLAGSEPVRPEDAARVYRMAADQKVPLVGAGDLMRLQRARAAVSQVLQLAPQRVNINGYAPTAQLGGASAIALQLTSDARPKYISVSNDVLVGMDAVARLGADPAVRTVQVQNGGITVLTGQVSDADRTRIEQQARGINGLQSARVYGGPAMTVHQLQTHPPAPQAPPARPDVTPPVPPTVPPAAAFDSLIDAYARALESHHMDSVQTIAGDFAREPVEALFQRTERLRARLRQTELRVQGDRAVAMVSGELEYLEGGIQRSEPIRQRAIFARTPGGAWRIISIK